MVVIGGGVAGLAAAGSLARRGISVILVERSTRLGGLVETERSIPGVTLEHGADAILADKPGGLEVVRTLGLERELVREGRATRRAFVTHEGRLVPMPAGLFAFERRALFTMLASPLLSAGAKARLATEPLVARSGQTDESVASFFSRRLGPEVEARLVRPMVRGIFGSESAELGVRSVFPKLAAMEDRWGSVGLALALARRGPRGVGLVTLARGMESLPRALGEDAAKRGARLLTGVGVSAIEKRAERWSVVREDGARLEADAIVVATEVRTAARLLAGVAPEPAAALGAVRSTDAEVVSLVYRRSAVRHPLDGTGFVSSDAHRATLACTFGSEKWRGRAPDDVAVFRSVLRGARDRTDDEIATAAHEELRDVLGLTGDPTHVRVRRRRDALPVYGVGHRERIDDVREGVRAIGGLALAGNYLGGVGVPDAIASGLAAARELGG